MNNTVNITGKRPRIMRGQLVASTNMDKVGCIKVLYIEHRYIGISYKRVARVVIKSEIE